MKAIWKFEVPIKDELGIFMPKGAEIISFQMQRDVPCIWAICDTENTSSEERKFKIYGTGHPHEKIEGKFIGTIQIKVGIGSLVWHLFEKEIG